MSACNILKQAILNHMTGQATWTADSLWYISLHTGDPGADGSANELSGDGYERQMVGANDTQWSAPSSGIIENLNNIAFPMAGADWPQITHFALHTQVTGAYGLVRQALLSPITILNGGVFQFAPGKLRVKVL